MLIVVRHGRTDANAAGLLLGQRLDPGLDDVGSGQAAALAAALGPVDRVVSSPLRRARETAAAFATAVEVDERWIELDYGELDGVPIADVPTDVWKRWRRGAFAPPGGESHEALQARITGACESLVADATERDVVVVTHVSPVKAAVAWVLDVTPSVTWRLYVAPASITRIATSPTPVLREFNVTAHLS